MIFVILIGAAFALFLCWNLIPNRMVSNGISFALALGLVATILMIVGNFKYHYGMERQTVTTEHAFASVNPKAKMLLVQQVGKKSGRQVVIYKKRVNQKKPTVTPAVKTTNVIKTNAKENKLIVEKHQWVYKNNFYRLMFGLAQKETFISRKNTFYVKNDYLVLTPQQAKRFGELAKQRGMQMQAKQKNNPQAQAAMQQQGAAYVQSKLQAATTKQPKLTAAQKEQLSKRYAAEFKQQVEERGQQAVFQEVLQEMHINPAK